jgi:hypothetical protein
MLRIYQGKRPDNHTDETLLLVSIPLLVHQKEDLVTLDSIRSTVVNEGNASWFRITEGTHIMDGDVGTDKNSDIRLNSTKIVLGKPVHIKLLIRLG